MDALAHLALMTKAKLVFEDPDTFMSFPALAPIGFKAEQLKLGVLDSVDNAERLVYSEFARITNSLPDDTIFEIGDQFLWDVYGEVLRSAELATGTTTPEEDAAYQLARDFLGVADASGLRSPSPEMQGYQQFRDVWFNAVEAYKAAELTATTSTDPAVVSQWQNTDKPRLRAVVEQARGDWEARGFKAAVEQAQQVEQAYAARSPELGWRAWSSQFDPDIDLLTDPAQQEFAGTTFLPGDIFDQEWPTFRLAKDEIADLIGKAPEELKGIFAPEGSQSAVKELSFEFRSVKVARHWFRPEVFSSRSWRLPGGARPLSDGASPPSGRWPAYVAALVFARNIQVTMEATQPAPPVKLPAIPPLARQGPLVIGPGLLEKRQLLMVAKPLPIAIEPVEPVPDPVKPAKPVAFEPVKPVGFKFNRAILANRAVFKAAAVAEMAAAPAPSVPLPEPPP
ncbi:MAG TPA: hypothetical protein VH951_08770, partial [Dehalococcoidia bacterium]